MEITPWTCVVLSPLVSNKLPSHRLSPYEVPIQCA